MPLMPFFSSHGFEIEFQAWGRPEHRPILFFHGFPGSHLQASALTPLLEKHRIFLLAFDRPGYGGTKGHGSHADFLDALMALLNKLKVDKCALVAVSGGAPLAHMMAARFPEQVSALAVVGGLASFCEGTRPYFSLFQRRGLGVRRLLPAPLAEQIINFLLKGAKPEKMLKHFVKVLSPPDRRVLEEPDIQLLITKSMQHARKQGSRGLVRDSALFGRDWLSEECDRAGLKQVPIHYFHGEQDRILDHRMAIWMHEQLPHSTLKLFKEEGHYSIAFRQAEAVLEALEF